MQFLSFTNITNGVMIGQETDPATGTTLTPFGFYIYYSGVPDNTVFEQVTINGTSITITPEDVVESEDHGLTKITVDVVKYGDIPQGYEDYKLNAVQWKDSVSEEVTTETFEVDAEPLDTVFFGYQTVGDVIEDINIYTTEDDIQEELFDLLNTAISKTNLYININYPMNVIKGGLRDMTAVMPIDQVVVDNLLKNYVGFEVRRKETEEDVQQQAFLTEFEKACKKVKAGLDVPDKYKPALEARSFGRPKHSPQWYYRGGY